ncbi:serine O-acetyltransferase [Peribacillus frigoritolerans]|uniref:serine O-acetyltransferase n=1 Tax=Peribacillus frigoritolerans TaxID=450367 RepID=UPI003871B73E
MKLNSCDISPYSKIGSGLTIYHSVGIVVGNVTIGKNLKLFQNVTIGSVKDLTIGDNAELFSGCCVLANIGDNSKVGANAVVLKDVPLNSTAVGSPARIITNNQKKLLV